MRKFAPGKNFLLGFFALLVGGFNLAHAAPESFVYEGILQDTNGPVTTSSTLILRIYDPGLTCLLYEEIQTVTPETTGSFSVRVGSAVGAAKRTSNDPGLPLSSLFAPSGVVRASGSTYCTAGYTAAVGDSRRLILNVNGTDLSPSVEISSAPFAVSASSAESIGSYPASKLLRSDGSTTVPALDDAKVSVMMNILSGTLGTPSAPGEAASKSYVDTVAGGLLPLTTGFGGDVSGTYNALTVGKIKGRSVDETGIAAGKILKFDGTKWTMGDDNAGSGGLSAVSGVATLTATKVWVGNASNVATEVSVSGDATLAANGTLTLANTLGSGGTLGSAQSVPQLTYDAKGRITAATAVTIDDTTKLPKAGGTMTGALDMGGKDITNTGNITMAASKYLTLSDSATPGTVPGQIWYNAGKVYYWNGSSAVELGAAGAGLTSLNGLNSASQSFAIGTSGMAPNFSSTTSTHTLNIPMASTASVTAGLLSNTEYLALNAKQSAALTSSKIWIGNASGVAQEQALGGDVSLSNTGTVTVTKTTLGQSNTILSLDSGGVATMYGAGIKGATSGLVTLQAAPVSGTYSLTLPTAAPAAGQVLQSADAAGNLSWATPLSSVSNSATLTNGTLWLGNASNKATEVAVSGDATLASNGTLTLANTLGSGGTVGSAQSVPQLTYDAKGRLTAATAVTIDDTTKLPKAGGTMTGALDMGGKDITNTGHITMAASKYLTLSNNATPGTVAGQVWYSGGVIKYFDGSSAKSLSVAGAPSSLGSTKIWVGNASNLAEEQSLGGDVTSVSNTGVVTIYKSTTAEGNKILGLDGTGVANMYGAGLKGATSGAVVVKAADATNNFTLTLPNTTGTSGQVLTTDGTGLLSWTTPSGGGGGVSSVSAQSPLVVSGTASAPTVGLGHSTYPFLKSNGTTWSYVNINIADLKTTGNVSQMPTTCTSSQTWYFNVPLDKYECVDIQLNNMAKVSTADAVYYVNSSGDDSLCNGSQDAAYSAGQAPNCAFQTLQGALTKLPEIIKHNVNLRVTSNLIASAGGTILAAVDKTIAAKDPNNGPFLTIEGYPSMVILDGNGYTDVSGISIYGASRGVQLKNLQLQNFTSRAVDINGGIAVIDSVNFSNNTRGISVSSGGMAMFFGNINITLSSSGTDNRGIEVSQASVSNQAALNIDLGSAQNSRGLSVSHGEFSVEDNINISQSTSFNSQTGVEVSTGGELNIQSGKVLGVAMSGANSSSSAINVRGGRLSVSGLLTLKSLGGQGLSCESGAQCEFYGDFQADNSTVNAQSFVSVRGASVMNVQGNFEILGTENSTSAAIEVADRSVFKYSPYQAGAYFTMNRGGVSSTGSTALRVKNGSSFVFETMSNPGFNITNFDRLYAASGASTVVLNATFSGVVPSQAVTDESSRFMKTSGGTFPVPGRSCAGGMSAAGSGLGSTCIDSTDSSTTTYFGALNTCASRGLRLCSSTQYSIYCANGSTVSVALWGEGSKKVTCSPSAFSSVDWTSTSSLPFRCCE